MMSGICSKIMKWGEYITRINKKKQLWLQRKHMDWKWLKAELGAIANWVHARVGRSGGAGA